MTIPEHRPLNKKQLDILRLLYRFRFTTTDLLTQALQTKSKIKMNERLKILLDQEYIGRNFEPEYRLLRKHASYYLLPNGIDALRQMRDNKFDASILRNIRRDKTREDQFIDYCLGVFDIYCQLRVAYGDSLHFLTKSQLVNKYDYFSEFIPSVYTRVVTNSTEKDYFLEYLQSSKPFFAHLQRLKEHVEYGDTGEWEAETDSPFPKVLLVCDKPGLQNRLLKKSTSILADADDEMKFYVTTKGDNTWFDLAEPVEALSSSPI